VAGLRRPFGASIEARRGVSTGISARDRALTIRTAVAHGAGPADLVMPGHVFPVVARKGGVLVRAGLTEASIDLVRLAGLQPAAAVCAVLRDDGTLAEIEDLEMVAEHLNAKIVRIADLVAHRLRTESLKRRIEDATKRPPRPPSRLSPSAMKNVDTRCDDIDWRVPTERIPYEATYPLRARTVSWRSLTSTRIACHRPSFLPVLEYPR